MPRAGTSAAITTSAKAVFQCDEHLKRTVIDAGGLVTAPGDGSPCEAFRVDAPAANTANILVGCVPMHVNNGTQEFFSVPAGSSIEFGAVATGSRKGLIEAVYVKSASGTQSANYGVTFH